MTEMLAMGNYGAYVWSSFGLTLIVLVICVVQGRSRHQSVFNDVRKRIRAMEPES
jgi:heme exporter protein CcmD